MPSAADSWFASGSNADEPAPAFRTQHSFRGRFTCARSARALAGDVQDAAVVISPSATVRALRRGATGEGFCQPKELRNLADFFLERFAGKLLAHLVFHGFGMFSLCRSRISPR